MEGEVPDLHGRSFALEQAEDLAMGGGVSCAPPCVFFIASRREYTGRCPDGSTARGMEYLQRLVLHLGELPAGREHDLAVEGA